MKHSLAANPWEAGAFQSWNQVREAAINQRVQSLTANMPPPEAIPDAAPRPQAVERLPKGTMQTIWIEFVKQRKAPFAMKDFFDFYAAKTGRSISANKSNSALLNAALAAGQIRCLKPWLGGGIPGTYQVVQAVTPETIPGWKLQPVPLKSAGKIRTFAQSHAQFTIDELASIFTGYAARSTAKEYASRAVREGWLIRLVEKPAYGKPQIFKLKGGQ